MMIAAVVSAVLIVAFVQGLITFAGCIETDTASQEQADFCHLGGLNAALALTLLSILVAGAAGLLAVVLRRRAVLAVGFVIGTALAIAAPALARLATS